MSENNPFNNIFQRAKNNYNYYGGLLNFKFGNYENAEKYFKEIEYLEIALLYLGIINCKKKEFNQAEIYLLKIKKDRDIELDAQYYLGLINYKKRNYKLASKFLFSVSISNNKYKLKSQFYLGIICYKNRNFSVAITFLKMCENDVRAKCVLGIIYRNMKKYDIAEKYLLSAIEKNHFNSINELASLYKFLGNFKNSEKYYLLALQKEPKNDDIIYNLALLYEHFNHYELAEKYYLLAISYNNIFAANNLGILYYEQNKLDLAEKYYLLASQSGYQNSLYNLANLYHHTKKFKLSEFYYSSIFNILNINDIIRLIFIQYHLYHNNENIDNININNNNDKSTLAYDYYLKAKFNERYLHNSQIKYIYNNINIYELEFLPMNFLIPFYRKYYITIENLHYECCICYETSCNIICRQCHHDFHIKCLLKWNKNCPICRT